MERREYRPAPVDTSDVILPEELLALTEKIAENVHDVWAAGRIAEGKRPGEKDDAPVSAIRGTAGWRKRI